MVEETILQNELLTRFVLPFILIFFVIYAILEKTKIFGGEKHQINAIVSLVIGLIVVGVAYPVMVISNMILFLSVAMVVILVGLLLWGFISGNELGTDFLKHDKLKWVAGIAVVAGVIIALLWSTGTDSGVLGWLFGNSWSNTFWTNAIFLVLIAAVVVIAWRGGK